MILIILYYMRPASVKGLGKSATLVASDLGRRTDAHLSILKYTRHCEGDDYGLGYFLIITLTVIDVISGSQVELFRIG